MAKTSIGTLLLNAGIIKEEQLEQSKRIQEEKGGRLGDILIGMGALSEEQFQQFLAKTYHFRYYNLDKLLDTIPDKDLLDILPYKVAANHLLLPLQRDVERSALELATLAPLPEKLKKELLHHAQCKELIYCLGTRENILKAIRYHYARQMMEAASDISGEHESLTPHQSAEVLARMQGLCPSCSYPCDPEATTCPNCGEILRKNPKDPLIGMTLSQKWKLLELVGEGGMGLIYKAVHVETHQDVAIKLLRTQFKVDEQAVQRFYHESQILRKLNHPNIIDVHEFDFEEEIGFYLVMERLEGCDLEQHTARNEGKDLPLELIFEIFIQVADAMYHAHEEGVIHRDLKPENIFLVGGRDNFQKVKLLDFGIAKITEAQAERLTQTGMTLGTPRYLSPEQAMGTGLDHRTDIYSLSVIMFEILTMADLFHADSPYQYLMRHVYTQPAHLWETRPDRNFPVGLDALLQAGLAKNPNDRPANMKVFRDLLIKISLGEFQSEEELFPSLATSTTPPPKTTTSKISLEKPKNIDDNASTDSDLEPIEHFKEIWSDVGALSDLLGIESIETEDLGIESIETEDLGIESIETEDLGIESIETEDLGIESIETEDLGNHFSAKKEVSASPSSPIQKEDFAPLPQASIDSFEEVFKKSQKILQSEEKNNKKKRSGASLTYEEVSRIPSRKGSTYEEVSRIPSSGSLTYEEVSRVSKHGISLTNEEVPRITLKPENAASDKRSSHGYRVRAMLVRKKMATSALKEEALEKERWAKLGKFLFFLFFVIGILLGLRALLPTPHISQLEQEKAIKAWKALQEAPLDVSNNDMDKTP